jgi:hypothetical protein
MAEKVRAPSGVMVDADACGPFLAAKEAASARRIKARADLDAMRARGDASPEAQLSLEAAIAAVNAAELPYNEATAALEAHVIAGDPTAARSAK